MILVIGDPDLMVVVAVISLVFAGYPTVPAKTMNFMV